MHILLVHNNRYKIYLYGIYEGHTDAHVYIIYNPLPLVIMVMFCILIGSDPDTVIACLKFFALLFALTLNKK